MMALVSASDDLRVRSLGPDLHIVEGPTVSFYGAPYPTRMVVVRLPDGGLWVWSPVALDDAIQAWIDGLGPVAHLVSPNKIHHLSLGPWKEAYPSARLHASPGLSKRRPALAFDAELGDAPDPAWADVIEQCVFAGSVVLEEVVFFHRPTATLIVADLIENFGAETLSGWFGGLARVAGIVAPDGMAPLDFRLSFIRRGRARASFERVVAWGPRNIVMAHGEIVIDGGVAALRHHFRWLVGSGS